MSTDTFIGKLPKAELHIHLEGSLEPELLFKLAQRNAIELEFETVDDLRKAYVFSNLQEFLDIYYVGMNVLRTEDDFFELADAYLRRAAADNVRHVEAFFDPQAHLERGVSLEVVMNGFERAITSAADYGVSVYLIPCILRHLPASDALTAFDALEPFLGRIHGIGLDSSELGNPPNLFTEVYDRARAAGLKLVAHAGEEGPPEYVWQAIDTLRIDRIDHGNRALEDPKLVRRIVDDGLAMTVCPLSNLALGVVDDLAKHPLRAMLQAGIAATINSDDPAYFGGYINENYRQTATALDLGTAEIALLARNSFAKSFLPDDRKSAFLHEIDTLERELSR